VRPNEPGSRFLYLVFIHLRGVKVEGGRLDSLSEVGTREGRSSTWGSSVEKGLPHSTADCRRGRRGKGRREDEIALSAIRILKRKKIAEIAVGLKWSLSRRGSSSTSEGGPRRRGRRLWRTDGKRRATEYSLQT